MTDMTKTATKRHRLTTAGIVTAGVGILLVIIGFVGMANGSSFLAIALLLAFLLVPVGVILMIAGWMIRMRQAAERR